jgi:hypothetical protein
MGASTTQHETRLPSNAKKISERSQGNVVINPKVIVEEQDVNPTDLPKRMVAMHIGYLGTNFRGTLSCQA